MKKVTILCSVFLFSYAFLFGQVPEKDKLNQSQQMNDKVSKAQMDEKSNQLQTYDDFEGNKVLYYGTRSGMLDTVADNPITKMNKSNTDKNNMSNNSAGINTSKKCAKYTRSGNNKFDNIKMNLKGKLIDVNGFATYTTVAPKIKMKVYTTAPAGTLIEIQFGKRNNINYPGGTNSQYQAYTTVSNAWEEVEFKFSQTPKGSETTTTEVDQITLLFNPNTSTSDVYYFDDIKGPALIADKSASAE